MKDGQHCRWVVEKGFRFHVPGCWGAVHGGPENCYCPKPSATENERLDKIEQRLITLEKLLSNQATNPRPFLTGRTNGAENEP